jgi:hypothetical protein
MVEANLFNSRGTAFELSLLFCVKDVRIMFSINKNRLALFACASVGLLSSMTHAQTISSFQIAPSSADSLTGNLRATISGQQKNVTNSAFKAWIVEGGKAVLWSAPDGAGGYENEGQSLWRYEAKNGQKYKLAADYFMIESVREVKPNSGKLAYLMALRDGGLGAPLLALVDPKRGVVWRQQMARLTAIRNGRLAVGLVTEDAIADAESTSKSPKISQMLYPNIDDLLKRPVIVLKRSGMD